MRENGPLCVPFLMGKETNRRLGVNFKKFPSKTNCNSARQNGIFFKPDIFEALSKTFFT